MANKKMIRNDLLKALIAAVGSAALIAGLQWGDQRATAYEQQAKTKNMEPAGSFTAGTYTGEATGIGKVVATLTFNETNLTDVELDTSNETPEIGGAATEELKAQLLEKQSPVIDVIAGATVTSQAVEDAAKLAFEAAMGGEISAEAEADTEEEIDETDQVSEEEETDSTSSETAELSAAQSADASGSYKAGTYTAYAKGIGMVGVTVTVSDTEITEVELDVSEETAEIGGMAADELKEAILKAQSAEIDAVSGATETSRAVKYALENALTAATS